MFFKFSKDFEIQEDHFVQDFKLFAIKYDFNEDDELRKVADDLIKTDFRNKSYF